MHLACLLPSWRTHATVEEQKGETMHRIRMVLGVAVVALALASPATIMAALWIAFHGSAAVAQSIQPLAPPAPRTWGAKEGDACIGRHGPMNPALTEEWRAGERLRCELLRLPGIFRAFRLDERAGAGREVRLARRMFMM
jgi:hypothetical protein